MNRFPLIRIILAGAAIPFTGCLYGTGSSTEHQPTGMYRCIGESEYPPGELERILRDLKAQNPQCAEDGPVAIGPEQIVPALGDTTLAADSINIRAVVLDERCNLVSENGKRVRERNHGINSTDAWDMSRADGAPAETGIYYINVATERADGTRDTSYAKVGIYRDPCGR